MTIATALASSGGTLTKLGAGSLALTAANTYTGGTTLGGGTLSLGNANAIGTTGTIAFAGGTLQYTSANSTDYSSRFSTAANQAYSIDTNGQSVTLATALTSSGGTLTKLGSGALTLTAAESYTGGTTISAGTLQLGNGTISHDGSVTGNIADSAAVLYDLYGTQTYAGVISGAGSLTMSGSGTLILIAANTYGGGTTVSGGKLQLGDGTSTHDGALVGNIGNSGSVVFDLYGSENYSGVISGTGTLTKLGGGTLALGGVNTYGGGTTLSGGTLQLAVSNALPTSTPVTMSANSHATLDLNGYSQTIDNLTGDTTSAVTLGSGAITFVGASGYYYGPISGTGSVVVNGWLVLDGANSYTGGTTVNSGSYFSFDYDHVMPSAGTLTVNAGGQVDLYGTHQVVAGLSGGGVVYSDNSPGVGTLEVAVPGSTTSTFAGTIQDYLNDSAGKVSLLTSGTGTLALTGANTYTGGTTLNGGKLQLGSSGSIGATGTISFGGGTLQYHRRNTTDYSSRFSTAANQAYSIDTNGQSVTIATALASSGGSLTKIGSGTLTLTAANTFAGGTTINGGTLSLDNASAIGATGTISFGGGTLQYTSVNSTDYSSRFSQAASQIYSIDTNGQSVTLASPLTSSAGRLTKLGSGTLTLTAANSYSGVTTVTGGTLDLDNANALAGSTLSVPTAASIVFDQSVSPAAFTFGGLSGSGNLSLLNNAATPAPIALTVGGNNANTGYSGILSDGLAGATLTKTGSGSLKLNNANTYTGLTTISGGTLQLGNGTSANGSVAGNIADYAALVFDNASDQTYSGVISGTGSVTAAGPSDTLTLSGQNTYSARHDHRRHRKQRLQHQRRDAPTRRRHGECSAEPDHHRQWLLNHRQSHRRNLQWHH